MRKIDFIPGYHEWHIIVDGEVIHVIDDFSDRFDEVEDIENEIYALVYDIIYAWKEELWENDKTIPLTEHEMNYLREMMYNVICNYYL